MHSYRAGPCEKNDIINIFADASIFATNFFIKTISSERLDVNLRKTPHLKADTMNFKDKQNSSNTNIHKYFCQNGVVHLMFC